MENIPTLSQEEFISYSLSYVVELRNCDYQAYESTMKDLGMSDEMFNQYDENLKLMIRLGYIDI